MSLTNVSDIEVVAGLNGIALKCKATYYGEHKPLEWRVSCSQHFHCCGMKTMQGMDVFNLSSEFQTLDFCRKLRDALTTPWFRGGNVSFILNSRQRGRLETLLKNMNRVGAGIKEIPFANKNMRNTNYLYIWTYTGRKPKKTAVVADAPSEN